MRFHSLCIIYFSFSMFTGYLLVYQVFCFAFRMPCLPHAVSPCCCSSSAVASSSSYSWPICLHLLNPSPISPSSLLLCLTHSNASPAPLLVPLQAFARHYSQLRHTNKLSASRFPADGFYITHTAHAHTHTRKNLFSVKPGILRGGEEREVHTICGVYTRVN